MSTASKAIRPFWNGFALQLILSNLPSVLVFAILPFIAQALDLEITVLGTLFLLLRLGSIAGAQMGPLLLRRHSAKSIAIASEVISAVMSGLLAAAFFSKIVFLLFIVIFLKGINSGLLNNARLHWLKNLHPGVEGQRVLLVLTSLGQSFYGVAGILIFCGLTGDLAVKSAIVVDALTSLIGAYIFTRIKIVQTAPVQSNVGESLQLLFSKKTKWLLTNDVLLCAALAGTNMLLVKAGQNLFDTMGGYSTSLIIYAAGFLVAGWYSQARAGQPKNRFFKLIWSLATPLVLVGPLIFMMDSLNLNSGFSIDLWKSIMSIGFFILFFTYPLLLLRLDGLWFQTIEARSIAGVFALRAALIGTLLALGEPFYAAIGYQADSFVRFVFVVGALLVIAGRNSNADNK